MRELGIYVHIPYCSGKCKYCSFVSSVNLATQHDYVNALIDEITGRRCDGSVTSVYVGGGTPSALHRGLLRKIICAIKDNYELSANCEITVEGNPESADNEFLSECKSVGVNRLSFGLQCADDTVLKNAGRRHSVEQFINAVDNARSMGFDNISGDLIIGLEGENDQVFQKSLQLLVDKQMDHISVYSLSVEENCIMFHGKYRPDEDEMADQYAACSDYLVKRGYERYEVSNFALNGRYSRHNVKYWQQIDYLGFGVAAHSLCDKVRSANTSSIRKYIGGERTVEREMLSLSDQKTEYVMLRLRLSSGLDIADYKRRFSEDITDKKRAEIDKLILAGVIEIKENKLCVTDKGMYVLNYIITELI